MRRKLPIALAVAALMASFPIAQTAFAQYGSREHTLRWPNSGRLDPRLGWQTVNFEANSRASALYLDIRRGAVQIDRAEIVFRNGRSMLVDLNNAVRTRGRVQIARFNNVRNIDRVLVTARPRSVDARIALWRDSDGYMGWNDHRIDDDDWRWRR